MTWPLASVGISLATLALVAGCAALSPPRAETKRVARVGFLGNQPGPNTEAFLQGLRELGYVEGQNIHIEFRFVEGQQERYPQFAAELASLQLDVLVAASAAAIRAAKEATSIPIVMGPAGDPVRSGVVVSLDRPGGNVTGLTAIAPDLSRKRLDLLKEAFPEVSRVAVLWSPRNPDTVLAFEETQAAADVLGVKVLSFEVSGAADFAPAFEAARRQRAEGFLVFGGPMANWQREEIVELAARSRLPAMYSLREFVDAGGLMAYGVDLQRLFGRTAVYVDKILKGADPGALPVEQPDRFHFVVNLATAEALGLTLPSHILLRATELIR